MANETLALVRPRPSDPGGDYESFCAALGSSARGRAFLIEYARRNRNADTEVLLAALNRLEAAMRSHPAAADSERLRRELLALHDAIRTARDGIDDSNAALRASRLAALIEQIERHIAAIVAPAQAEADLPIPSPANDEPRATALMLDLEIPRPQAKAAPAPAVQARPPAALPAIDFFDGAAAPVRMPPPAAVVSPAPVETEARTETAISAFVATVEFLAPGAAEVQARETAPEKRAAEPLAGITALSEAERLALFT